MKFEVKPSKYNSARYFEDAASAADYIAEEIDPDYYDEFLDEAYGDIEICGVKYSASTTLEKVDPIAYNVYLTDWRDGERGEIAYGIEHLREGEETSFYGISVRLLEE